jgi:hypothetical protein
MGNIAVFFVYAMRRVGRRGEGGRTQAHQQAGNDPLRGGACS